MATSACSHLSVAIFPRYGGPDSLDLHLEAPKAYDVFEIVPKAPYLALLGDVGNIVSHKDDCLAFLTVQLNQFRDVLFVPRA